ncbi:MAG: hypothetical protein ACI915_005609 [Gammaproteobacteria bacterium]|jgi:hypothetical protein
MAQTKVDWEVLRGALGLFAICFFIGAVVLGASYYFREEMAAEFKTQQARFRDVSRKYLAVDDEERIIAETYPKFVQLYKDGILGREHRLSWLEALRRGGEQINLPEISYRIKSQDLYVPEFKIDLGAYNIYVSEMNLTLGLLHEGDLMGILDALNRDAEGLYSVSKCNATRTNEQFTVDVNRPTITAECYLNWYTIDLKGDRKLQL